MEERPRIIVHFDLDSFFVSVEQLRDPSLKGRPVLVGGQERGVVAACSYEARRYGIHSAMPMKTALRLCPEAVLLRGDRPAYSHYSRVVTDLIASRAPLFEKASIDEFYLDLSGMDKYFRPYEWTIALRKEIMEKTGLPISFAMASNKMVAKIGTDEAKPNGYLQVPAGFEKEFLAPLAVGKIPGVGAHTQDLLHQLGIETIRDLAARAPALLEKKLGRLGPELWRKAQGLHDSPVQPYQEAKSVSTEHTFDQDLTDVERMAEELVGMTEKVAFELRQEDKMAGCLAVKIRYNDFDTTSRQSSIPYSFYDHELIPVARELFRKLYQAGRPVRLLGVRASELTGEARQTNLFDDVERKSGLYRAIDDLKIRFGRHSVTKATGK